MRPSKICECPSHLKKKKKECVKPEQQTKRMSTETWKEKDLDQLWVYQYKIKVQLKRNWICFVGTWEKILDFLAWPQWLWINLIVKIAIINITIVKLRQISNHNLICVCHPFHNKNNTVSLLHFKSLYARKAYNLQKKKKWKPFTTPCNA